MRTSSPMCISVICDYIIFACCMFCEHSQHIEHKNQWAEFKHGVGLSLPGHASHCIDCPKPAPISSNYGNDMLPYIPLNLTLLFCIWRKY
jgi:hypothetical protein